MELSVTAFVERLTCPQFSAAFPEASPDASMPLHLQGQILHAIVEAYLREEQVAAAFNLLAALPADPALRSGMMHRACNLLSFANLLIAGATRVETEVPLRFSLPLSGSAVQVFGRCDCLVNRRGRLTAVDWKASPRLDLLDQVQLMCYLYAALIDRDQPRGEWLLYYYDQGVTRQGSATLKQLEDRLRDLLERALNSESLRPSGHCTACQRRRECTASAYFMG